MISERYPELVENFVDYKGNKFTEYRVSLVEPRGEKRRREFDSLVRKQMIVFGSKDKEQEILDYFKFHRLRLPITTRKNLMNLGSSFYRSIGGWSCWNFDLSRLLEVDVYQKIDIKEFYPIAIEKLMSVVENESGEELTLGDKTRIKDIALEAFQNALYLVTDFGTNLNLSNCFSTHKNEHALEALREYGFKVNSPRFAYFDIRGIEK